MATSDPKTDLHHFLQVGRDVVVWKLEGLSDYDVRRPLVESGTNLLGLVKHLASVELGYFGETFDRPFPESLPWLAADAEANADMWATADESRDEIVGLYRRAWAHADATIRELPLDATGQVPWWPEDRREVTLHQVLVRMIAETHRHAGHADIVRELVDGATGHRAGVDNMAAGDAAWWQGYRARLEGVARDALDAPRGVTVSTGSPPSVRHGDIGYVSLWVPDGERAAAFFSAVLDWHYAAGSSPRGRQVEGHALHHGLWGGVDPATLFCCYTVEDIAAAIERVGAAGGTAGPAQPAPFGLVAECDDDQGVRFAIFEPPGGVAPPQSVPAPGQQQGDLAYVTMEVVDSERTRAFYGSVLGWRFSAGSVADGWQVDDVAPMVGISGGHERATTVPMYRVDDIAAAVAAVRAAGGATTEPETQPYGITAACSDDQGTRFYLGQL